MKEKKARNLYISSLFIWESLSPNMSPGTFYRNLGVTSLGDEYIKKWWNFGVPQKTKTSSSHILITHNFVPNSS